MAILSASTPADSIGPYRWLLCFRVGAAGEVPAGDIQLTPSGACKHEQLDLDANAVKGDGQYCPWRLDSHEHVQVTASGA